MLDTGATDLRSRDDEKTHLVMVTHLMVTLLDKCTPYIIIAAITTHYTLQTMSLQHLQPNILFISLKLIDVEIR